MEKSGADGETSESKTLVLHRDMPGNRRDNFRWHMSGRKASVYACNARLFEPLAVSGLPRRLSDVFVPIAIRRNIERFYLQSKGEVLPTVAEVAEAPLLEKKQLIGQFLFPLVFDLMCSARSCLLVCCSVETICWSY